MPSTHAGETQRDAVLDAHERIRGELLTLARRRLLEHLLRSTVATMDDVAGELEIPPDIDARCLGAAGTGLARGGIIVATGFVRSARPSRNASPVQQWRLVSRELAEQWLSDHRPQTTQARQRLLPGLA